MGRRVIIVGVGEEEVASIEELAVTLNNRIPAAEVVGVKADKQDFICELSSAVDSGVDDIMIIPLSIPRNNSLFMMLEQTISEFVVDNNIKIECINEYTTEFVLEDMIWETITSRVTDKNLLPELGVDIEKLSHKIIDSKLQGMSGMSRGEKIVARRVIHSTADYSFADTLRFSANAVSKGIEALKNKKPIICDVNMLKTAMTKVESEIICLIADPEVISLSKEIKCTRAAAAMLTLKDRLDGAIVVIGNAPTAIWQLLKMDVKPAVVVGLPVGFVGARESKLGLIDSGHEYIANTTPRGGSPAAAAALNALALLAKEVN